MNQKRKPLASFDEFRQIYFEQLAEDKSQMFNFFLQNNHVFQFINQEDVDQIVARQSLYMKRLGYTYLLTMVGTFVVDRFVLERHFKIQKYPKYRLGINLLKYVGYPLITYQLMKSYGCGDIEKFFVDQSEKYNFGYHHYNKGMDILERAYRVNKMDELIELGQEFDWSNVPEFKSKYSD
ncbi:hypothetical protein pb186bvf_018831 [Paramecium bursaria]